MGTAGSGEGELNPEISKLTKALVKDPRSKVFLQLAEEYLKAGMVEEAVPVLTEGLKHYPTFVTARVMLGRAYHQLGDKTKARAMLEDAIRMSPENLVAHRTLARIYVEEGALEKAAKSCTVVLAANPKDEECLALQSSLGGGEPSSSARAAGGQPVRKQKAKPDPAMPPGGRPGSGLRERKIARLRSWLENIQRRRG